MQSNAQTGHSDRVILKNQISAGPYLALFNSQTELCYLRSSTLRGRARWLGPLRLLAPTQGPPQGKPWSPGN